MPDTLDQSVEPVAPGYKPPGPITIIPEQPATGGGLLDRVHARLQQEQQGQAGASGGLLDRVHARLQQEQDQQKPDPDMLKPEGSAAGRFGGGFWDTSLGPIVQQALSAVHPALHAGGFGPLVDAALEASGTRNPTKEAITGMVQSHVAQAEKAKDALSRGDYPEAFGHALATVTPEWITNLVHSHIDQAQKASDAVERGDYTEAFGHSLASAFPMFGPMVAHGAERMGGDQPVFDRYGRVIAPGHGPDIAGGMGEEAGIVASVLTPHIIAGVRKVLPPSVGITPRSTLNPVKQAGVDFLHEENVPMTAGTRTGNPFLESAEKTVSTTPLGYQAARGMTQATEAGLTRVLGNLADQAHPTPVTPEMAGRAAAEGLGKTIDDLGAQADEGYGRAWVGRGDPAAYPQRSRAHRRTDGIRGGRQAAR